METQELTTIKMDPSKKSEWVKALRDSTRYKQAKEVMYSESEGDCHYMCCLGVLEHLCGTSIEILEYGVEDELPSSLRKQNSPKEVLNQKVLGHPKNLEGYLAYMNDNGFSFDEIANWIEKNL